jgi:CO/xanthine dehydrogenase Mo-binding subunit
MTTRRRFLKSTGALVLCFRLPELSNAARTAHGYASLGNRLWIGTTGTVKLAMGKVELGQGIGTALAQVAAEELGVAFGRVELVNVDTDFSPDESYTFSSISVQQSVPPVRRAAAAGKQILLQRAAEKLGAPVGDLTVEDGAILSSGGSTGLDYWQLITAEHIEVVKEDEYASLPVEDYSVVGESVHRIDIPAKVFGEASYLQDLRLPDMLHARVVRPPAERAELKKFDPEPAHRLAGVVKIVRDGNFVGVIAEREGQARDAAKVLGQSIGWSLAEDLPCPGSIYEWLKSAPARTEQVASRQSGLDAEADMTTHEAAYQRPYQAHASISPSAAIALFDHGKLTVWSHAQGMYPLREAIAHTLGLELDQVRCVHREAAGCFGHNGADDAACDAAALAMQLPGKPIRLQWERADEFGWEPYGSAMHIETHATMDSGGQVRSWEFDIWSCPHASRPRDRQNAGHLLYAQHKNEPLDMPPARSIPQPTGGADRNGIPLYAFDNLNVKKHLVTDVPLRVSALRGLGAYANVFAIESFMDELALAARIDPIEFRIKHLQDERAIAVLQRLAVESDWSNRPKVGSGEGWGVGFAKFKNLSSYLGVVIQLGYDLEAQKIALNKATAVCDAGLVINPDGVRAQIEGGIVQSASWTLKEQLRYSESGIDSRDWETYPILRFDEVPEVRVVLMPRDDKKSLGVGETAQGPTAAAIANALYDATLVRLRSLPLSISIRKSMQPIQYEQPEQGEPA